MNPLDEQRKSREIIVSGTVEQFIRLVEIERGRSDSFNPDYDGTNSKAIPSNLYGPITRGTDKAPLLYWLVVVNSYNWFLDYYEKGKVGIIHGSLKLQPGVTLDEYDREARRQGTNLSSILGTGELCVVDLPGEKIRVIFNVSRFHQHDAFWGWVNSFIVEMERQGFKQQAGYLPINNLETKRELLRQHQRNLDTLRLQAAKYGSIEIPLSLQNQIEDEENEIAGLKAELANDS